MTDFVFDTFSSGTDLTDHVGETGATWTRHALSTSGYNTITSGKLYGGTFQDSDFYPSGNPASADYDVSVDVYCETSGSAGYATGVWGRLDTSVRTGYLVTFNNWSNTFNLQKFVSGTATGLGTAFAYTMTTGETKTLKLQMRGSTIKMFVDGVERISVTDTAITAAGKPGVYTYNGHEGNYGLDNFTATDATGGGATATLSTTTADAVFSGTASVSPVASLSISTANAVFSGAASVSSDGVLTFPLTNNTGTLLAGETGATVHIFTATWTHVVTKTGQTSNGAGVMTVTDAALTAATEYRVVPVLASGDEGMDRVTAA